MGDESKGDDLLKKAEKKINGWGIFGSKYEDAAELFDKAANQYKLAKAWDKAGNTYLKLAECHLKMDSKHEAASACVDAANCYKKINTAGLCFCTLLNMNCCSQLSSWLLRHFFHLPLRRIYNNVHAAAAITKRASLLLPLFLFDNSKGAAVTGEEGPSHA
ncbi:Alpha-soluble NSF attachment protein [Nymphaea thermarum]|nr:Alpha-soluble NSF attachment protein [Nymphaea thermarum]